jgi:hypothetical protein
MNTLSLDTFLVGLYTITDDLYKATYLPVESKPGAKPIMTDSEIITLALCAQWIKWSERKLIQYVKDHWQAYFPSLVGQSEYNKRFKKLANHLAYLVPQVETAMHNFLSSYEVFDCVPVPLMKRCRGERTKLFKPEIANIGKGGSDQEWYYGVKLGLSVNPGGWVTGFILAPARTSDRWPAEFLFCYRNNPWGKPAQVEDLPPSHGKKRIGPGGMIWPKEGIGRRNPQMYLLDRGFNGVWWREHWESQYQTLGLNPDSYGGEESAELRHIHASYRQVIENVNEHLSDELGLNQIGARSVPGLLARVAAKLLAFNIGVWLNKLFGRSTFALATLFSL